MPKPCTTPNCKRLHRLKSERDERYPRVKIFFKYDGIIFSGLHLNRASMDAVRKLYVPNAKVDYDKQKEIQLFLISLTR